MRKVNFFLLCILLLPCLFSRCVRAKGQDNTMSNSVKFKVTYQFLQQALKDGTPFFVSDTMALEVGENYSVYYDLHLNRRDSLDYSLFRKTKRISSSYDQKKLEEILESRQHADNILHDRRGETARIFKERFMGNITTIDRNLNLIYRFKVVENVSYDWEISPDTMTVLNYACMKAVIRFRGRTYTAWFTPDIPISDGPWKFYGLPGMILRVEDSENIFTFEAIGLEKIYEISFDLDDIPNSKADTYTYKQFNDYKNNSYREISLGFYDSSYNVDYYRIKNPTTYPNLEIE